MNEDLGTQGMDEQDPAGSVGTAADTPQGAQDPAAAAAAREQYFLDVDERHRYKTREDAIRAISESGQHISRLTPWQEHASRYGVTDPNHLPRILDQYLEMRDKLAQYERERAQAAPAQAPNPQGGQGNGQQLDPKDQANIRYLEQQGFTRKEAIDKTLSEKLSPLESRINGLEGRFQESQTVLTNAAIDQGRQQLSTLMTEAGLPVDNPEMNEMVENSIVAWMEANSRYDKQGNPLPGTPLHQFYQGGAATKEVVRQGAAKVLGALNSVRQLQDGQAQRRRQQSVAGTPRALPKTGAPVPTDDKGQPTAAKRQPGAGGIFNKPELHDKAWALMQERRGGGDN